MDPDRAQPWNLPGLDINQDGRFSLGDIWAWAVQLLFLPGDAAIAALVTYLPKLAAFLELGPDDYGGTLSVAVSVAIWLVVLILAGLVANFIRNFDQALTTYIAIRYNDGKRGIRIFRRRFTSWIGYLRQQRRARERGVIVGELDLERFDSTVLRCFADSGEVNILAAADVANRLKVSLRQVQSALRRLTEYHLVERAFGTDEGRDGHHITRAGQIYLIEH
jgi:DNA-binding MarR family transcriptional regulator